MKSLYEKIITIYPTITSADFMPGGTIQLQNNSDGLGDIIKEWNHPTLVKPTDEQIAAVKEDTLAQIKAKQKKKELQSLAETHAVNLKTLNDAWVTAAVKDGENEDARKTSVLADITELETQYLADVAAIRLKYA